MNCFLVFLFTCAAARNLNGADEFQLWQLEHGRSYNNLEEAEFRHRVFESNMQKIRLHNERAASFKVCTRSTLSLS